MNWYKKAKIVGDEEVAALLSRLSVGDQMELFKSPMWDTYSKGKQMSVINQKLKNSGKI